MEVAYGRRWVEWASNTEHAIRHNLVAEPASHAQEVSDGSDPPLDPRIGIGRNIGFCGKAGLLTGIELACPFRPGSVWRRRVDHREGESVADE